MKVTLRPHEDSRKVIRHCIMCDADDATPLFDYDFRFMTEVRWSCGEDLKRRGWTEELTNTVVKCRSCGCVYLRDFMPDFQRGASGELGEAASCATGEDLEAVGEALAEDLRQQSIDSTLGEATILRSLFQIARASGAGSLRFLDYGAGSGTFSLRAAALGASQVVAYDPGYAANHADAPHGVSALPITWVSARSRLPEVAPFEAAVCVNVIEHMGDPRLELQTIYDLLVPGGVVYINNPWMDLERSLPALKSARKIRKADHISCFHPKHYNYLSAKEFAKMSEGIGYRVTPYVAHKEIPPFGPRLWKPFVRAVATTGVRYGQNLMPGNTRRQSFVLQKPRG